MAEDWAADVRKYAPDADDKVIAAIVRYCGIALQNRDSSLVSFTDPVETGRVRENFLKKKLGLLQPDAQLDDAIAAVGTRMKGANFKNRVTVYYLLLEHFGLLHLFGQDKASVTGIGGAAAGAAGVAAVGLAGRVGDERPVDPILEPVAAPIASAYHAVPVPEQQRSGFGWWPWLLLALLALALLWWLFFRTPATPPAPQAVAPASDVVDTVSSAVSNVVDFATVPAEGTIAIPAGAGVTAETRNGKPVVKVYFDTGKADVVPAFAATAQGLKTYLASHAGSSLAVSGFNDETGTAAINAELSKNRAEAVRSALVAAGIAESSVALVKPVQTTDTSASNATDRRVEVVVR